MGNILQVLGGIVVILMGWFMVAFGQVFLAIRDTAINTQKENAEQKPQYTALLGITKLNNFVGWIAIFAGFILMVAGK